MVYVELNRAPIPHPDLIHQFLWVFGSQLFNCYNYVIALSILLRKTYGDR